MFIIAHSFIRFFSLQFSYIYISLFSLQNTLFLNIILSNCSLFHLACREEKMNSSSEINNCREIIPNVSPVHLVRITVCSLSINNEIYFFSILYIK